jgi:hypothetical protein
MGCSSPPSSVVRHWSSVRSDLTLVPLTVFGVAADDIWIGGGGLASVPQSLLLHGDREHLVEVATSWSETIWWIHGASANDVWAVGDAGLAVHWDGVNWTRAATGTTATLFGVWVSGANDVWAVGGSPNGGGPSDVILHFNGAAWAAVPPPRALGATYFKVWGLSASDVHVVASEGLALHYDGATWSEMPTGTTAKLVTVHGGAAGVHAIGGPPATLLSWEGNAWHPESTPPEMSGAMSGIFSDPSGTLFATGERYQRFERDPSGAFTNDTDRPALFGDLHAVWADGQGNALAVGGNYVALTNASTVPAGLVVSYGP